LIAGNLIDSENRKRILTLPVAGTGLRIKLAWSRWLILARFFLCLFIDRDRVDVHKHAKKEQGQYPAEQAWSIKDLLNEKKKPLFSLVHTAGNSEPTSTILPARVANYSAGFGSSCPLMALAIVKYHGKSMCINNRSRH